MKIEQLVGKIKKGSIHLPNFQRGYIWKPADVVSLMNSLYREYPVGLVTTWDPVEDEGELIVDGQQRMSSIYACYTDEIPKIHEQAEKKPRLGLYFNVSTEEFKFATQRDRQDHMWLRVSEILNSTGNWRGQIRQSKTYDENLDDEYAERVSKVRQIKNQDIPIQDVKPELTADDIVEIFVRINKQGKTVKRGELEMARLCIAWPEARQEIRKERQKWATTPLTRAMNEDAIIRTMTAVHTGRYPKSGLQGAKAKELEEAFKLTAAANASMAQALTNRLSIHDARALLTIATFPAIARFLKKTDGKFATESDEAKAIAYHLTAACWGVYHGSTDSQIDQDVQAADSADPWDALYNSIRSKVGEPVAEAIRFRFNRRGGRFFPMVQVLQMQPQVRDFLTLRPVREYSHEELDQHHIFPRHILETHGVQRADADTMANIALIAKRSNIDLGDKPPEVYLKEIDQKDSKMLNEHCIPRDPDLWKVEKYDKFLQRRSELLAQATNTLMQKLREGRFN